MFLLFIFVNICCSKVHVMVHAPRTVQAPGDITDL